MIDRLRALLDRPLDPGAARAILVFASAILVGIAGLFVLAASEQDRQSSTAGRPASIASPPAFPTEAKGSEPSEPRSSTRRQDPQDVKGSTAASRAARALRSHRALQHVPYRSEGLTVELVGAHGRRAVLRVRAATPRAARREWRHFLQRYKDSGHAYLPIFYGKRREAR